MIEKCIHALLAGNATVAAMVGGRISPVFTAQAADDPRIVYQRVGTLRVRGSKGPAGLAAARVQVSVYDGRAGAEVYANVKAIADACRRALDGFVGEAGGVNCRGIILQDGERDAMAAPPGEGQEKPTVGVVQEYLCWFVETPPTH